MKLKAIIAAGGRGTRLRPLTFTSNKHLLPIANKPLLFYPLENIINCGIKDIGVVVNETRPAIESLLGDGHKWGVNITYINQPEPKGLANVVLVSQPFLGKSPFVYHLGDNIFSNGGIKHPVDHFVSSNADAVLTIVEHPENFRLGVPFFDAEGKLTKIVEKPQNPPNKFGVPGLYMFNHHVFEAFSGKDQVQPSARGEYEIVDLYNYMLSHGYKVEVAEFKGEWRDPGKFDDSLEANRLILSTKIKTSIKGEVDQDSKISGNAVVGKGTKIINSQIIGPVIIGSNCSIQNSTIGPFASIGDGCQVRDSQIENSILMDEIHVLDVNHKIEASMIGAHTEIISVKAHPQTFSLTVADYCKVEVPN